MELADSFEGFQGLAEAFVFDAECVAEFASGEDHAGRQQFEDLIVQVASWLVGKRVGDHFQVGALGVRVNQLQSDGWHGRRGAVFAGQQQVIAGTSEVEVGITEGMDVA